MKNKKFKFTSKQNCNYELESKRYNVILLVKHFDSVVLLDLYNDYDFIRFSMSSINNEIISNEVERILGVRLKINFRGTLQKLESKEKSYLFYSSVDSMELKKIQEFTNVKIISESYLKNTCLDEKYEIYSYLKENNSSEELIVFIIIPIVVFIVFGIWIYNLINGKVNFELTVIFVALFFVIIAGIYGYKKK